MSSRHISGAQETARWAWDGGAPGRPAPHPARTQEALRWCPLSWHRGAELDGMVQPLVPACPQPGCFPHARPSPAPSLHPLLPYSATTSSSLTPSHSHTGSAGPCHSPALTLSVTPRFSSDANPGVPQNQLGAFQCWFMGQSPEAKVMPLVSKPKIIGPKENL